ncbi:hypothetical protein BESB_053000 [Besnoitia besnoiti]|uniref:Transmembrane protein n=1 Tax=Besnoitia besnoiti TaxID=94643 RepID=A0A2A9MCP1_BESBE|nr:hypothetical protein BESB_053000 [Besnoitia besnoiti]PFH35649.1 hypothetical protein BESB_053000 [Besnoitia besnoiti]
MPSCRVVIALVWAVVSAAGLSPLDPKAANGGLRLAEGSTHEVVKSLKRAMNQRWRNGGRSICSVFGCDYEQVKSRLSYQPTFFLSFKAVCAQFDEFEEEVSNAKQREEDLTPSQKEYRWLLLTKAAALLNDSLGTKYEVPEKYVPQHLRTRHYVPGWREDVEKQKDRVKSQVEKLQVTVPLPTLEGIQKEAGDRLAALRQRHVEQIRELEETRHRKWLLLQEEHDRQTAQMVADLKLKQAEEADTLRRELIEEKRAFDQSVKVWDMVSRLLNEAHAAIEAFSDRVHSLGQQVFKLKSFHEKLQSYQQASKNNPEGSAPYSALSYAFQSESAVSQAMQQVHTTYQEASVAASRIQEILNQAETAMAAAPSKENAPWFQQHHRGYKDRLESFSNLLADLTIRLEDHMQTAEERKLVTLFSGDEVRTQVLTLLQDRTSGWTTRLTALRERAHGIEAEAHKFFESSAQLDRNTGEVLAAVLQNPEAFVVQVATYSTESNALRETAARIEEELKSAVKALQELEREVRGMADGISTAQLPPAVIDFLGLPALFNAVQVDMQLKPKGQQLLQHIKARLSQLVEVLRKLEMVKNEVKNIRSPAEREQAEWSLNEASAKLQEAVRSKSDIDLQIQQLTLQLQQLQATVVQLEQRINHERLLSHRAAGGGRTALVLRGNTLGLGTPPVPAGSLQGITTLEGSVLGLRSSVGGGVGLDPQAVVADLEQQLQTAKERAQETRRNLAVKQRDAVAVENEIRRLDAEVSAKQREMAEEQQKMARVMSLCQALGAGGVSVGGMSVASIGGGLGMSGGFTGDSASGILAPGIMGSRARGIGGLSMGGMAGGSVSGPSPTVGVGGSPRLTGGLVPGPPP